MSDVREAHCDSINNGNQGAIVAIIIVFSVTLASVSTLCIVTICMAKKVAKHLAQNAGKSSQPDVIVVEEIQDLKRQSSSLPEQMTLNGKDLLDQYYDKLPDNDNASNQQSVMMQYLNVQVPRSASNRSSRHSSLFPAITEENELDTSDIAKISPRVSCGSLGPNFMANKKRNSSSTSFGTMPRKVPLRRMSSQEQVNQLTRFLLLNEDVDLFKESSSSGRRGSSGSSRKLSMDHLFNAFIPDGGTLKKSMTSLSLHSPIPAVMQKLEKRKKAPLENKANEDVESTSSVASEATLKAEPIEQPRTKYIKNQKNRSGGEVKNYDTLTYRRTRRVGVHFSQSIRFKPPEPESEV